ncbi:MAG: tetratricopeptide repeat protein [Candidatus Omnitrophota bacterium]
MRPITIVKHLSSAVLIFFVIVLGVSPEIFARQDEHGLSQSLAHYTMGLIYDLSGLTEEAVNEYKQAAEFDKENYFIHFRLGSDYARMGMLPEAIAELNLVSKIKPADLSSRYLLALIYSNQKEYKKSADEYEFILQSLSQEDPENIEISSFLGQLYYSQGKYEEAIGQFLKILSREPRNANVMYLLGSLYLEVDQRQEAIGLFSKAIEVDPKHDGSLNSLAYVYAEEGQNLDEALTLIQKALEIDPENGAYLDSLGWVYYKKKMYQEALGYLQKADTYLNDPVVYDHLGDVYYQLNQQGNAEKYWRLSLELLPQQKEVLRKLNDLEQQRQTVLPPADN